MEAPRSNNNAMLNAASSNTRAVTKVVLAALAMTLVLCLGTWGAHAADPTPDNPNTSLTATAVDEAVIAVVADHAFVEVNGQAVNGTGFKVPAGKALTFDVFAEDGYSLTQVSVTDVQGNEVAVSGDFPSFSLDAADVVDGLTITVAVASERANAGLIDDDEDTGSKEAADAAAVSAKMVGQNLEFTYDGQPHTVFFDLVDADGQLLEDYFVVSTTPFFTNVTDSSVAVEFSDFTVYDYAGVDVTDSFANVEVESGSISIEPAVISISTPSDTKVYDGTPLQATDLELTMLDIDELMDVVASITVTGSQTEIGESVNTYSIDWGTVNQSNYIIEESLGTLSVTANEAPIVITMLDASKPYDGTPLTSTEFDFAAPSGYTAQVVASGSQTNAGTSQNTITSFRIFDAQGNDVTSTFSDVVTVAGTLTVEPAELIVTTPSASKSYDGQALTATASGWIQGFAAGETATASITGSQTEVGSSQNTYSIEWNGTAQRANYRIIEDLGTLEVTEDFVFVPGNDPIVDDEPPAGGSTSGGSASPAASPASTPAASAGQGEAFVTYSTPIASNPNVVYLTEPSTNVNAGAAATPNTATNSTASGTASTPSSNATTETGANSNPVESLISTVTGAEEAAEEVLYDDATPLAGIDDSSQAISSPWRALGALMLAALAIFIVLLLRKRLKDAAAQA